MIIFLSGPDTYRSRQKLNEIIKHYKQIHKSGLNLKYLDSINFDLENVQNEVQTNSMFGEKKLLVFNNILSNLKDEEKFLNFLQDLKSSNDIMVIYEEKDIDKRTLLVKFLQKNSKHQEFNLLGGEKLRNWIKKEFNNYKAEITPEALEELINSIGNNLWLMANEIKKLVSYVKKKKINIGDVKLLVKPEIEMDIFTTIDAISEKKKKQALTLIHKHLEKGDNPLYLLSMINFQFRNLLEIKDLMEKNIPYYSILKKSNLHPFVIRKSYWQARRFTLPQLKKIYQKIFQVDLSIKTGKIEPETALDLLITGI